MRLPGYGALLYGTIITLKYSKDASQGHVDLRSEHPWKNYSGCGSFNEGN